MAYKYSQGSRILGDIEYEGDRAETQIDFEDDFVALKTGGNQVLVVSGSAVGVGTSSPDNTLHVKSSGTTHVKIESEEGYEAAVKLKSGDQNSVYLWAVGGTPDLRFYVNGADRMHLDGDGKIGIGTTNPDEMLTINASADGDECFIHFQEAGTDRAQVGINTSNNLVLHNQYTNKHIVLKVNDAGVTREGLRINGAVPEVVVNEGSESLVDFRVESNNSTHMLFVDGGTDTVGVGTSSPGSALHVNASFATAITGKTSDYTLTGGDHTILVDCSSGNVTLTLPTAVGCAGRMYVIKRIDATNNAANINAAGSEEIDGSTIPASVTPLSSIMLQSDNSNWWKIAEYILPP
jgi:hypothetical protein